MIRVETVDLVHRYPTSVTALNGVDFIAEAGDFVVMLGPNGSGKTTLLKHFVGLLKPSSGKVLLDGKDSATLPLVKLRADVGFVFQDPNDQLFAVNVAEDVAFGPRNLGLPPSDIARRVVSSLETVGARGLDTRPVHSLSFGQKRRVALAGVLAMSPKVLVLDEPTSGLDPMGATRLMALLRRLNEDQGVTIIVATHDVELVPAYAQTVYLMRDGKIVAAGSPPAVFSQVELLHANELRMPRVAHAFTLLGNELGHPIVEIPLTMEEPGGGGFVNSALMRGNSAVSTTLPTGRAGFTTGVAAAAAARAAAELLICGKLRREVDLRSPLGSTVTIPVASVTLDDEEGGATATVIKKGVSPDDVTHGVAVCALVKLANSSGIHIDGGVGVGRATSPSQKLQAGEAAINPIPRQMIADAVSSILPTGLGLEVVISVPRGEEIARQTNNLELGIVGGISILGTDLGPTGTYSMQQESFFGLGASELMAQVKRAIILIGHGSRAAGANDAIFQLAEMVKQETGHEIVEVGFMGLSQPSISESIETCTGQGATKIIVIPYFLHMGIHMQKDLPGKIEEIRNEHPEVELVLGKHLGFHPKLAEIVVERIRESAGE